MSSKTCGEFEKLNEVEGPADVFENEDGELDNGWIAASSDTYPKIWDSNVPFDAHLDCGMHLLFHGIVAYIVEQMVNFMKFHGLNKKFEKEVNHHLLELCLLRLDWCKVKTLPKKQWLAENEIGYCRVIPYLYARFFQHAVIPERYNTSPLVVDCVKKMLHAMHVMLCNLMSPATSSNYAGVDNHVKIFLGCCNQYSRGMYGDRAEPFWCKTGNFPTLLCLPAQIRRYGPVRWYWEGTSERHIQDVKRFLTAYRRSTRYLQSKMEIMHKTVTCEWIEGELRSGGEIGAQKKKNQENITNTPRPPNSKRNWLLTQSFLLSL